MNWIEAIIMAVSLCADCFAVSLCSSVTLKKICWKSVLKVSIAFAIIQSGLLLAGWLFGTLFQGLFEKIAHIIACLLLAYVGGSMLFEGIKGKNEERNLNGWKNIILGGVATSIDALMVGISQSLSGTQWLPFLPLLISVFAVTAISVICGIWGGKKIGSVFGRWAEIIGGAVLILIGISIVI